MIIENLRGQKENVSLPKPIYTNNSTGFREDFGTGIQLDGVYYGPRSGRAFIMTDSIWEDRRTHGCVGQTVQEIEIEELLRICDKFGIDVPSAIPTVDVS